MYSPAMAVYTELKRAFAQRSQLLHCDGSDNCPVALPSVSPALLAS